MAAILELPFRELNFTDEAVQMPHQCKQNLAHTRVCRATESLRDSFGDRCLVLDDHFCSYPVNRGYDAATGRQHPATEEPPCPMLPSFW
jgi:hypothetical protein